MSTPFIGEIRIFAGSYAPENFEFCHGQELPINQKYQALYTIVGAMYGPRSSETFFLPDLRGTAPMHTGKGTGLTNRPQGARVGTNFVTLTNDQIPAHNHVVNGVNSSSIANIPTDNFVAAGGGRTDFRYQTANTSQVPLEALAPAGGVNNGTEVSTSPHNNMQPFLSIEFIIAFNGTYPPQG